MLLSLFCGAGGLDLGFEQAGFGIGLAFDKKLDSIDSYNHNRKRKCGRCQDVRELGLEELDGLWGGQFAPEGVIGGPPCQSFSQANRQTYNDDPRHELPYVYARLLGKLNRRNPVKFFALENVPGLERAEHLHRLEQLERELKAAGFHVFRGRLNARDFLTPQNRERLFLVGLNEALYPSASCWSWPNATTKCPSEVTVSAALKGLPEPFQFHPGADPLSFPHHRNHWCMKPKSARFSTPGALTPGDGRHRSFKVLAWDRPSITVAYGHREVHVHPDCKRRLSVYEAMLLQGFPGTYELLGSLSSQIDQVSEAVPPKMARAVAEAVRVAAAAPSISDQLAVAARAA